jgi:hypothetical protein
MTHYQYKKFLVILKKIDKLELRIRGVEFEEYFKHVEHRAYKFALATYGYEQANRFDWEARNANGGYVRMHAFLKHSFIALQKLKTRNELRDERSKKSKYKSLSLDG